MKSKIALFVFAMSVGVSAAQAVPDNWCYKMYNQCMNDPRMDTADCNADLEMCLAS